MGTSYFGVPYLINLFKTLINLFKAMKMSEIKGYLQIMERQMDALREQSDELARQIASLLQDVMQEEVEYNTEDFSESFSITEEDQEDITLPPPPEVIYLDLPDSQKTSSGGFISHEQEVVLGCKLLTLLPDFYVGRCSLIKIHKQYFDNGQPKLFINKYKVKVSAFDASGNILGTTSTHWNNLAALHTELINLGINTHAEPNWMPKIISLYVD